MSLSDKLNIVLSQKEPHQLAILSFDQSECEKFFKYYKLFQNENDKKIANEEIKHMATKPMKEVMMLENCYKNKR